MERHAEYKDSGVDWLGEIPAEWELIRVGSSFRERREKVSDVDFEPLSVTKNGIVPRLENAAKTNDGDNRKLVRCGDFVINSRSDRKGSSGIAKQDGSVSLINIVMEPKGIDPTFCNHLLKSYAFVEEFYRMGHGIVADLWTTRYSEMKAVLLALPTLHEQTAIANFLDKKTVKIDEAMRVKQRQIELLKERKQTLTQNAVTKGLNPNAPMKDSGIGWIGDIPVHWEVKQLKRVMSSTTGFAFPSTVFCDDGIPLVRIGDLSAGGHVTLGTCVQLPYRFEHYLDSYGIGQGAILMAMTGGTIGKTSYYSSEQRVLLNQRVCRFIPHEESLYKKLALLWMKTKIWKDHIDLEAAGGAQPNISDATVLEMFVALSPNIAEQQKVAEFVVLAVQEIDSAITIKENQIEKLNEYKTTLINAAVTGKVKVPS